MLCRFFLLLLLAAIPLQLHAASPQKARSLSGSGLLLLRSENGRQPSRLVLYREPGLGRIAELDAAQLPQLCLSFNPPAVIVTAKKLGWYRIVYDDGEREGWLQGQPAYRYQRWEELLQGREAAFPTGLRKEFYLLRSEPDSAARQLDTIDRESSFTVVKVAGDWINVRRGGAASGWLRWRDENGRLLIAVDCSGKSSVN
jgi:hypothetical protein